MAIACKYSGPIGFKKRIHFFNKWITLVLTITQLLVIVETAATSLIEGNNLETFKLVGWMGTDPDTTDYANPGQFRDILTALDNDVTGNGVWIENITEGTADQKHVVYKFRGLPNQYCDIKTAKVTIKYYMHHATAILSPCKSGLGGNEYCYLENPSMDGPIAWKTSNAFDLERYNEIKIEVMLLKGGYIIFDHVTIDHDGSECGPTTSETTNGTERTTNWETTTHGTTETHDPDGTDGPWTPETLPTTDAPPTTHPSTVITDSTGTTENEESEEEESDPTGVPTSTEDPTASTSFETSSITTHDPTGSTSSDDPTVSTSTTDPTPEEIHIDVEGDIPTNGNWSIDCAGGYQELLSSFDCKVSGGVELPIEDDYGQKGFWTGCERYNCTIKYYIQPEDTSFMARFYQTDDRLTGISADGRTWGFLEGNGWMHVEINLDGWTEVNILMDHISSDIFSVLDKIAINGDLPPLPPKDSAKDYLVRSA